MTLRRASSSGVNSRPGQTRSSGSTSSRTNSSAQSSFSWNSGSVSKSHAMATPSVAKNSDSDDARMQFRTRRTTLQRASPGRPWRSGAPHYADEVRRLLDAALEVMRAARHDVPAPGRRHRRRRRAVQRRLLPALPLQGRAGRRPPRGRHRAAAQLPGPPDGQGGRRPRARSGAGSRACWPRPTTRRSPPPPSPCCGTAAAWARACPRAGRRPAGRWPRCCASPSPSWAAPTPTSTPRSPPTRSSARCPTTSGPGPGPSPTTIDHIAGVCLALATASTRMRP